MTEISATYFDGRTGAPCAVMLRWHAFDAMLLVDGAGIAQRHRRRDVTIEPRIGSEPRLIRFADGGRCEVPDNATFDALIATWPPDQPERWTTRWETKWTIVAVVGVLLIAAGWAAIHFGLPWAARRIAFALPADILREVGDQTLATFDKTSLSPSQLPAERQRALQAEFAAFLARAGDTTSYRLEFRAAREMGANAFALPSGVIVVTDELAKLTDDNREIVGVLAHECGHIQHRHAMRGLLQNSAVFVMIALITGDVSSAATFGGALPAFLLKTRFSREFEREADAYAVEKLRAAGIDPLLLGHMLERLAESSGEPNSKMLGYLGTHPPTPERIEAIKGKR
jgi:predicted Zn-dependent protease